MAWTDIPNGDIAQDEPIKAETGLALRDNVPATAAQETGAPKIADKFVSGSGTTVTISGLDDFGGIEVHGAIYRASGATTTLRMEISTDGTNFTDLTNIFVTIPSAESPMFALFFDFATGNYNGVLGGLGANSPQHASGSIAGASTAITHIRFSGTTVNNIVILARPQGGASAS